MQQRFEELCCMAIINDGYTVWLLENDERLCYIRTLLATFTSSTDIEGLMFSYAYNDKFQIGVKCEGKQLDLEAGIDEYKIHLIPMSPTMSTVQTVSHKQAVITDYLQAMFAYGMKADFDNLPRSATDCFIVVPEDHKFLKDVYAISNERNIKQLQESGFEFATKHGKRIGLSFEQRGNSDVVIEIEYVR